ncbi:MAG: Adaptive-response sensory-kinase SasA [Syntrophus sp. SKADARSKE-3]|nr:Adaptive-response sensory-kinase SasA [Syntrophus sp. SKADARSKE-3]
MSEPLRILILEDNPADAELIQFELQEAGYIFTSKVVMTEEDYILGLREFSPDLILSDYDLPKYNGALALAEAKQLRPDTPFILVTGAVTEDRAIDILTQGAKDYVLKHRLQQRLIPAVRRTLAEAEEHRARKRAEAELREAHRTLEERVKIRTAELEAEVTARKKTEKALRKSEEILKKTFRSNPACIGLSRFHNGLVIEANDEALNVLGYNADEFIGHSINELRVWNDPADRERMLRDLMAVGRSINQEYRFRTKAGKLLLCNHSAELIEIEEEPHILFTFMDITGRRQAKEDLLNTYQRLHALMQAVPVGISFSEDTTCRSITGNPAALEQFEVRPEDNLSASAPTDSAPGRQVRFFHNGRQISDAELPLQRAVAEKKVIPPMELEVRLPSGRSWYAEASGAPIYDAEGNVSGGIAVTIDITARKAAEMQAKRSRNTFSKLIERSPFGTYIVDSQFRIAFMNQASQTGAFCNVRPVIGRDFSEAMHILWPDPVAEEIISHFRHTLDTGEPYYSPRFFNQRNDIEIVESYEWELHGIMLPDGQYGVICYYYDSTKLREVEAALRRTEERLATDLEAMTRLQKIGALFVSDGNMDEILGEIVDAAIAISEADFGNIQLFDPKTSDLHIAAHRGFPDWWIDFWNSVSKGRGTCGTALEQGARVIVEDVEQSPIFIGTPALEIQLKAGVRAVQSTPLLSRSGKILGMFSTHYKTPRLPDDSALNLLDLLAQQAADIIERAKAEEALRQSEFHMARVQEIAHLGSWAWDIEENHLYWSDETYRMFGLKPKEFAPRNEDFLGCVHPEDRPRVELAVQETLAHEPYNLEFRIIRKDGEERYVHSEGQITFDKNDNPVKMEGTVQDITERKQVDEELIRRTQQLEEANKELESFSYSVSHDLKAPLRAIDGYSKMLTKKYGNVLNDDASRMIGVIRSNTEMMSALIDDLLSFSRVHRGSMAASEIDMNKLASEVWNDIHQAVPDREIEFKLSKLPPGFGDRTLIRQALVNLFSNAVKFTTNRKPGTIEISSYTEDGAIVYCVKDNGVGFDMAYYHKLFGVFQRLHSHEEYEGSGIGLAIVQRIINRHGGRVWAESELEKGATFFFTLPGRSNLTNL